MIDQADFNDESKLGKGREMQDRLTKLVGIFEGLDFRANRAHGDDLLGDAYEYLMRHFATQSGKSKGQFYTPAEVSRIMAQVIGIGPDTRKDQTVYDPACGSGSLLIRAADAAPNGLTIYGQEKDVATWTMARMNLILHERTAAEIERDNTLTNPLFTDGPGRLKRFDFAVANPQPGGRLRYHDCVDNQFPKWDKNQSFSDLPSFDVSLADCGIELSRDWSPVSSSESPTVPVSVGWSSRSVGVGGGLASLSTTFGVLSTHINVSPAPRVTSKGAKMSFQPTLSSSALCLRQADPHVSTMSSFPSCSLTSVLLPLSSN